MISLFYEVITIAQRLLLADSYVRRDFVDTYDGIVPYFGVETTETRVGTETGVHVSVDM